MTECFRDVTRLCKRKHDHANNCLMSVIKCFVKNIFLKTIYWRHLTAFSLRKAVHTALNNLIFVCGLQPRSPTSGPRPLMGYEAFSGGRRSISKLCHFPVGKKYVSWKFTDFLLVRSGHLSLFVVVFSQYLTMGPIKISMPVARWKSGEAFSSTSKCVTQPILALAESVADLLIRFSVWCTIFYKRVAHGRNQLMFFGQKWLQIAQPNN